MHCGIGEKHLDLIGATENCIEGVSVTEVQGMNGGNRVSRCRGILSVKWKGVIVDLHLRSFATKCGGGVLWFQSQSQGEGGDLVLAQVMQLGQGLFKSEDGRVIDGSDVGADEASSCLCGGRNGGGAAGFGVWDSSDVDPL